MTPPMDSKPLPAELLYQVATSSWGFCEFCKDAFPRVDLRLDGSKKLACKGCFFRADVLNATAGAGQRCISEWQAEELARLHKIDPDAAIVELLSTGFKPKSYCGILFYVRSEAKA